MKLSKAVQRHTAYYLNMLRFYNRKHLNWRSTLDRGQIELALRRSASSTEIKITSSKDQEL